MPCSPFTDRHTDRHTNRHSDRVTTEGTLSGFQDFFLQPIIIIYINMFDYSYSQIGELTHLRMLDLHDNRLCHLPQSLAQLKHLVALQLANNIFDHIPEVVTRITSLQALNFSRSVRCLRVSSMSQGQFHVHAETFCHSQ